MRLARRRLRFAMRRRSDFAYKWNQLSWGVPLAVLTPIHLEIKN
jgi:hypothetical protein